MKFAGLIYDESLHYLDHLAPCAAMLNWPLIICEPSVAEQARTYYPGLEVHEIAFHELRLPKTILSCDSAHFLKAAFPLQKCQTLWLPHGNSDKGLGSSFSSVLNDEKGALVYGQKMIDFLKPPHPIRVGNFRLEYFLKHKLFYKKMLAVPEGINFLYAPTWDHSSSFWEAFPLLVSNLPSHVNLLIKLHPNTMKKFEPEIEQLQGRFSAKKNVYFLPNMAPIYPLLEKCSAYIGDMSSIGYDFLFFDRPLYFLNANRNFFLHQCGHPIDPKTFDYPLKNFLSSKKKSLYQYTFDSPPDWNMIQEKIDALFSS